MKYLFLQFEGDKKGRFSVFSDGLSPAQISSIYPS
jgi:hypothetical protein